MSKIKGFTIIAFLLFIIHPTQAQGTKEEKFNPLRSGIPSLTIAPDARAGAMGDIGAATEPDIFSQHWNPAKYAFTHSKAGLGVSYTPWLTKLVDDIYLAYLAGYYKLGDEDRQAVGASLRYFSLGEINLHDASGHQVGHANPYEMAVDLSYSRKLSEKFSGAATFRFIYSDMGSGINDLYPGKAFAVDISGYYNNYIMIGNSECLFGLGFHASNIGTKISFDQGNNTSFIPATLRLGTSLLFPMDDYNSLSLSLELSKLMVPTPPNYSLLTTDQEKDEAREKYNSISSIAGIFQSFTKAPGGAKEKFQEIMWSIGAEYAYNRQFFVRGGYFYENPMKGNRQYFSLGAGFKLNVFQLDVAYLISTIPSNPLDQTLRFNMSFDMEGLRQLIK